MAAKTITFETGHEEMIHDAQLDYYGKRLATASSDRSIRIFDVSFDRQSLLCKIPAADGPVWQVCWAHPKFGPLLGSCSYDGRAIVWKEVQQNHWVKVFETARTEASMNSISFAPHSFGLILVCGCSDGTVTVCTRQETDGRWHTANFLAHKGGVNAVSWGPDVKTGALLASASAVPQQMAERRFVTGGCDNKIRIWKSDTHSSSTASGSSGFPPVPPASHIPPSAACLSLLRQSDDGGWHEQPVFAHSDSSHGDWVRDVAWAPSLGLPANTIASCSEDKSVCLWYESASGEWSRGAVLRFDSGVWRVSWSVAGNVLAVSQGDQRVSLWKETGQDGQWRQVSQEQAQDA